MRTKRLLRRDNALLRALHADLDADDMRMNRGGTPRLQLKGASGVRVDSFPARNMRSRI